jgi:hypothetical protein
VSERFVEGYVVDPKALDALIGTDKLAAKTVRKKVGKKFGTLRDIEMTFGQGWDDDSAKEGGVLLDAALAALAKGRPTAKQSAYEMTRVTALILAAYAERLGTIEIVPFIEGDDFGLLSPVLKALAMPAMAKDYGQPSLAFPYAKRTKANAVDWPIMTLVHATLGAWHKELAGDWAKRLPKLADKPFVDLRYGTDAETIAETKTDVARVLATLKTWVGKASKQRRALVLILDGDQ